MKTWIFLLFCFAVAAFAVGCGNGTTTANKPANVRIEVSTPDPNATPPPELMATGRKLYLANCAVCHKENGTGGKVEILGKSLNADDLTTDKMKQMPDDKMYGYIYKGIEDEGMPSFKDKLSEAEIREVVRFIRIELQKVPELPPGRAR